MEPVETILTACNRIKNTRTVVSVYEALYRESIELRDEVRKKVFNDRPGKDGILGEAVDVILCAVDLIFMDDPTVTKEQIMEKINEKIEKWEKVYGDK